MSQTRPTTNSDRIAEITNTIEGIAAGTVLGTVSRIDLPANDSGQDDLVEDELLEDELLVEEISIDGMCGVY